MTHRSGAAAVLGCTIIWAVAAPAVAQPGFVGAAAGVHLVRFSHQSTQSPTISDNDTSGDSRGWSVVGGGVMKRHGVGQAEFSRTDEIRKDIPPAQCHPPCPNCGTSRTTVDFRAQQCAVLGGYTTGAWRRVSLAALGGIIFVRTTTHSVSNYSPPPSLITAPPPSESTYTQYVMGPAFGLDVPILAWRHIQVLPQFRIYKLSSSVSYSGGGPGSLVTTASAGVRWAF